MADSGGRRWAWIVVWVSVLLLACGDDDATSIDAGRDATDPLDGGHTDAMLDARVNDARDDDGSDDDGGGGPSCAPALRSPGENLNLLRLEGPDLRVHVVRRWDDFGAGESSIYSLQHAVIKYRGQCWIVSDEARLTYTNSHHNWRDSATVQTAARTWTIAFSFRLDGTLGWDVTASAPDVDGGAPIALIVTGATATHHGDLGFLPVHVNELMTSEASSVRDEAGEATAWVELYNPSAGAVDLSGYRLQLFGSSAPTHVFAAGTTLGRHEYLLLFADAEPNQGALHLPFALPTSGAIRLIGPDGTSAGERYFEGASDTQSYIRIGSGLEPEDTETPGAENPRF